jgi:hypothetical protein
MRIGSFLPKIPWRRNAVTTTPSTQQLNAIEPPNHPTPPPATHVMESDQHDTRPQSDLIDENTSAQLQEWLKQAKRRQDRETETATPLALPYYRGSNTVPLQQDPITFNRFMDLPPEIRSHIAYFLPPSELRELRLNRTLDENLRPHMQSFKIRNSRDLNAVINGRFSNIKHLDLAFCDDLSDTDCEQISKLPNLQSLKLKCKNMTDVGLKHIAKLTNLEELSIGWFERVSSTGLHDFLEHLKGFPNFRHLDIHDHMLPPFIRPYLVTDPILKHIAELSNLRSLNIACEGVTDAGLEPLKALTKLEYLGIRSWRNVTSAGMKYVAEVSNLRHLVLSRCHCVGNRGVKFLRPLPKLQKLDIYDTRVTDVGLLEHVEAFTKLQYLNIGRCHWVTKACVVELRRKLPLLEIVGDGS